MNSAWGKVFFKKMNFEILKNILIRTFSLRDVYEVFDKIIFHKFFQNKVYSGIMIAALSAGFLIQTLPSATLWDTDSPSYYIAAKGQLKNINIYNEQEFQKLADSTFGKSRVVFPYLYWPILAQLFAPLTLFHYPGYFLFLYVINILSVFFSLYLIYYLLELKKEDTYLPAIFLFFMVFGNQPLLVTILHGQINILVFNFILLSLLLLKINKEYASSLSFSLAILLKIYPVLFVILFLFYKKYKYLLYSFLNCLGICLVSLLIFGMDVWQEFINSSLGSFSSRTKSVFLTGFGSNIDNNSLKGFLNQIFLKTGLSLKYVLPVLAFLILVIIGLMIFFANKISLKNNIFLGASTIFILSLILSPLSWSHHYVVMIFPLAYLFNKILQDKNYIFLIPLLVFTSLIFYSPSYGGFAFNEIRLISITLFLFFLFPYHFLKKANDTLTI